MRLKNVRGLFYVQFCLSKRVGYRKGESSGWGGLRQHQVVPMKLARLISDRNFSSEARSCLKGWEKALRGVCSTV
jgi:hypothetical protein